MAPTALSERLRAARHAAGLTQAEVAKQANTTLRRIADWESGTHPPAPRFWPLLADALSLPLEGLFCPEGWIALPAPLISPATYARMQDPCGFEAVYELVCARIREAMLLAEPLTPVPAGRRVRSREQVLLHGHKPAGGGGKRGRAG